MSDSDTKLGSAISGVSVESGKAMGSAMKSAGGDQKDGGTTELFKINQVWYTMPPSLSLVNKRTLLRNQFQRTTYSSPTTDTMVCIFNTGEFYIAPKTSYMVIQLGYKNSSYANIAAQITQGNAMTLFEEPVLMSASGTEINREQNKGLQAAYTYTNTTSIILIPLVRCKVELWANIRLCTSNKCHTCLPPWEWAPQSIRRHPQQHPRVARFL